MVLALTCGTFTECAQCPCLGDAEQHRVARVHERSDVDVAQGDHSRERRLHYSVALHFIHVGDVGLGLCDAAALRGHGLLERLHRRLLRLILRLILIVFLASKQSPRATTLAPPLGRDARQFRVRLALLEIGLSLIERLRALVAERL